MKKIACFGGCFDPVHLGHLKIAMQLKDYLACDEMRLIPCYLPPHKKILRATDKQRLHMLSLAIEHFPQLCIDEREINRRSISYTIDSVIEIIEEEAKSTAIYLCIGSDAYALFTTWHRWQELLELVHLIVVDRIPIKDHSIKAEKLSNKVAQFKHQLHETYSGYIHFCQFPLINVSSTSIREDIQKNKIYLPKKVKNYIHEQTLYS